MGDRVQDVLRAMQQARAAAAANARAQAVGGRPQAASARQGSVSPAGAPPKTTGSAQPGSGVTSKQPQLAAAPQKEQAQPRSSAPPTSAKQPEAQLVPSPTDPHPSQPPSLASPTDPRPQALASPADPRPGQSQSLASPTDPRQPPPPQLAPPTDPRPGAVPKVAQPRQTPQTQTQTQTPQAAGHVASPPAQQQPVLGLDLPTDPRRALRGELAGAPQPKPSQPAAAALATDPRLAHRATSPPVSSQATDGGMVAGGPVRTGVTLDLTAGEPAGAPGPGQRQGEGGGHGQARAQAQAPGGEQEPERSTQAVHVQGTAAHVGQQQEQQREQPEELEGEGHEAVPSQPTTLSPRDGPLDAPGRLPGGQEQGDEDAPKPILESGPGPAGGMRSPPSGRMMVLDLGRAPEPQGQLGWDSGAAATDPRVALIQQQQRQRQGQLAQLVMQGLQSRASPQGADQEAQAKRPELLQTLALALSQKQKQQQQRSEPKPSLLSPLATAQGSGGDGTGGNGQQQQQVRMLLEQLQGFQKRMEQGQGQAHGTGAGEPASSQQAGGGGGGRETAGVGAGEVAASEPEEVDLTADGDDDGAEVVEVGGKRRLPAGAEASPAKRPSTGAPSAAAQQQFQEQLQQQLQERHRHLRQQQQQQQLQALQQQQQLQQLAAADLQQPSAQEVQLRHHLSVIMDRLREGTVPAEGAGEEGQPEMRPMRPEERQRYEEAALKLQHKVQSMAQERATLLTLQQAVRRAGPGAVVAAGGQGAAGGAGGVDLAALQAWQARVVAAQRQQQQQQQKEGRGSKSKAAQGSLVEKLRGSANGVTWPGAGGQGAGPSGGPGAAPMQPVVMPTAVASPKSENKAMEHQQVLRAVIESLQFTGDEELEPPPKTLSVTVLKHQRMALAWMVRRESGPEPRGGILADDQGLGKTVTTISLILTHTNPEDRTDPGGQARKQQQQEQGKEQQKKQDEGKQPAAAGGSSAGAGAGPGGGGQAQKQQAVAEPSGEGQGQGASTAAKQGQGQGQQQAGGEDDARLRDEGEREDAEAQEEMEDSDTETEEGDEDVDAEGVRLGALRAEREAAGAAGAAEAEGAAVDLVLLGGEGGGGVEKGQQGDAMEVDGGPGAAGGEQLQQQQGEGAGGSAAPAVKLDPGGPTAAAPAGASGTGSGPSREDSPDILDVTEVPATQPTPATPTATASTPRQQQQASPPARKPCLLPPSRYQPAAANAAASHQSQRESAVAALVPRTGTSTGKHGPGSGSGSGSGQHGKQLYEPEPMGLLLGGTLVVCPTSVLHQWAREIRAKVSPAAGLAVHVYHGKERITSARGLSGMGVVLTTYGTLAQEAPSKDKQAVRHGKQGSSSTPINLAAEDSDGDDPAGKAKGPGGRKKSMWPTGGPLFQIKWRRVVLDEAQSIKNPRTLAAHAAWTLHAHCRWCLSGTPIQNTVDDLYSYFRFLRYAPYCESRKFKELIKGKIVDRPEIGYRFLQAVLQTVLLRRTKQSTINGEPIIKLPGREQRLVREKFSAQEAAFYQQVQADSLRTFREAREGGASGARQYVNMLYSLLKLRQACNHPWLVRGGRKWHKTGTPSVAEVEAVRKLSPEARGALVAALTRGSGADGGGQPCPCCADIPEDPVAATCGHVFCQQCLAAQKEGAGVEGELLCPACSRLLRPADLHSAAALAVADPTLALPFGGGGGGEDGGGGGGEAWVTSAKVTRLMALLEEVRQKNNAAAAAANAARSGPSANPLAVKSKSDKRMVGALRKLPPLPSAPGGGGGGAGGGAAAVAPPDKVIVFSQWTSMLDLLEIPMQKSKIAFRRLDGTMTVAARERAIHDFESNTHVLVLLVSLKAAALGVNLTVANHVVLMDLWWNPTTEEQAIDRAHRIGQTRTVHVTRITVAGSVEDRILELQQRKRELVAAALSEGHDGASAGGRLSLEDLRFLFQGLAEGA